MMSRAGGWVTLAAVPRPPRTDLLLALGLAALCLLQVTVVYPIASTGVGVLVALATTLPLAWRRTNPVAATVATSLAWVIPTDGYLFVGYVVAFLQYYSLAAYVGPARTVVAVAALGVALSVVSSVMRDDITGEYFGALPAVVLPAITGRVVRRLREDAGRLAELTLHLERERERAEHAAVAEERGRIARELHDVVAHGVSVIAIQADAAEAALDRDPELARTPLRTIRRSAKEAMEEMRRLLDVLREDGDGGELLPQPGLGLLPELVEHARGAGVDVTLAVDGEPRPLAPGLDLSAYRIVQEGLTNVRKHAAGAPARVTVTWAPRELGLEVRDAGAGGDAHAINGTGGHGLVGMRERVRVHGGELHAGPEPDGGFAVRARLPTEERA
jgi:signal transduction histidine kinase